MAKNDPIDRAAQAARDAHAAKDAADGVAAGTVNPGSVDAGGAATGVSQPDGRPSAETVRTTVTRQADWETKKYPKWWLVAPSAAGIVGLMAWQMNGAKAAAQEKLEEETRAILKAQFPKAGLRFHGRDAIVTGISPAERSAVHKLVRGVEGVRNVKEVLGAPTGTSDDVVADSQVSQSTEDPGVAVETTVAISSAETLGTLTTEVTVPVAEESAPATEVPPATEVAPAGAGDTAPGTELAPADTSVAATTTTTSIAPTTTTSAAPTTTTTAVETATTTTTAAQPVGAAPATPVVASETPGPENITFERDSCELTADGAAVVSRFAQYLVGSADVRVAVSGHADSQGTRVGNLAVSKCRADAVRDALLEAGVGADRVSARGFSALNPVATNDTEEGRGLNRRAEIRLVGARTGAKVTYAG